MINYFNFKKIDDDYLLTNDMGKYVFVDKNTLKELINNDLSPNNEKFRELKDGLFIIDEHPEVFLENSAPYAASNKMYLFEGTGLFIFVVTKRCNLNCIYCQAKSNDCADADMTFEDAKKGVDIAISSPGRYITIEFQGGEPLLNFDVVKYIIEYSQSIKKDKHIDYCIATNLFALSDEVLEYFIKYKVNISTSLDGNADVHMFNRKCREADFSKLENQIAELKYRGCSINAIQTTTKYSLKHSVEIIDEYVTLGLNSIFIRPLTKLGAAKERWHNIGYEPDEFLDFYKQSFEYLIKLNKRGTEIKEVHASIMLRKILSDCSDNYMELRSPCGAGIGQMAINYNGDIYTCDEGRMLAEMGNEAFRLGDVNDTYNDLIEAPACKAACAASVLESQLRCCDCVYQPFCGVCPVINMANENDIISKSPRQYRCKIYEGILDLIFSKLKTCDAETMTVLKQWAL